MTKKIPQSEETEKAYFKALDRFFVATGGFVRARGTLKSILHYAFSENEIPTREQIPALRLLQKNFAELMEITFQAIDTGILKANPMPKEVFTPFGHPRSEFYIGPWAHSGLTPWDYFPHFLGRKEFINPSGFFEKFFEYRELIGWKVVLEELFHAGLLHQSIMDFSDNIDNAILLQDFLFKFIEASHLLRVRQIQQ